MTAGRCHNNPLPVECEGASLPAGRPAGDSSDSMTPASNSPSQLKSHCIRRASIGARSISASGMNRLEPKASLIPPAAMQTSKTTMPIRSALQVDICLRRSHAETAAIETPTVNRASDGKTIITVCQP